MSSPVALETKPPASSAKSTHEMSFLESQLGLQEVTTSSGR